MQAHYQGRPVRILKITGATATIAEWGFPKEVPTSSLEIWEMPKLPGCEICGNEQRELKEALVIHKKPRMTKMLCASCIHNFGLVVRRVDVQAE